MNQRAALTGLSTHFIVVVAFLAMSFSHIFAQESKWIVKGEGSYQVQDYQKAIDYFEWASRLKENSNALEGLGKCYRALYDYTNAEKYYRLLADQAQTSPLNYFYLGQALMANGKYKVAQTWFEKYLDSASEHLDESNFRNLEQFISTLRKDSLEVLVQRLSFNSASSDFSPMYFGEGLVFCSSRSNETGVIHTSTVDGAPLVDLYYTKSDTNGKWKRPKALSELNSKLNEGPLCIDSIRSRLYLTRNDPELPMRKVAKRGLNRLNIYESRFQDGKWQPFEDLPINNLDYGIGHPALSSDGERLYFSSDKPGGKGGTDIYYIERNGDDWSQAKNLGSHVNTPGNEMFPFLAADGTLYFASNGHLGLGGLDIFRVRPNGSGGWTAAMNVGYPINSSMDDFGIVMNANQRKGFFSTNRIKKRGDDVYSFERFRPEFECFVQEKNNYCFRFWDEGTFDLAADSLPMIYEWDFGDGEKAYGLDVRHCYEGPGNYLVELNLIDTTMDFIFMNEQTLDHRIRDIEQVFIDGPDTLAVGSIGVFTGLKSVVPGCEIEKYYWDLGDGTLSSGESVQHVYTEPGLYEISLGLTGVENDGISNCQQCITRKILVLAPKRLNHVLDSLERIREENILKGSLDSMRVLAAIAKRVFDARDSLEETYSVQLKESRSPIDLLNANFKKLEGPVREIETETGFKYVYGEETEPEKIYPLYKEAHQKGFEESIVVAFHNDVPLTGHDSTVYRRIPVKIGPKGVTLLQGKIVDSKGNPLPAEISLENLSEGIRMVRHATDPNGKFRLELPNGKLYGYYVDVDGYYPVSDYVDLRKETNLGRTELVLKEDITLHTINEIVEYGLSVRINNVFFDFDSAELRPESYSELDRLARVLVENSHLNVEILGHTDNWGSASYNLRLSQRRANAVLRYLIVSGYDVNKIKARGYGESRPLAANDFPEGRQLNRRVEFRFIVPEK